MGLPLFILRNRDTAGNRYDIVGEVLVAAESEEQARALMSSVHFYEDGDTRPQHAGDEGAEVWKDPKETPAAKIADDSVYTDCRIVMTDFRAG